MKKCQKMGPKMSEHFHKLQKFLKTRAIQKCQKISSNYKNARKSVEYKNVRTFSQITKMSEHFHK